MYAKFKEMEAAYNGDQTLYDSIDTRSVLLDEAFKAYYEDCMKKMRIDIVEIRQIPDTAPEPEEQPEKEREWGELREIEA
jgi:hypothetical protein